VTEFELADAPLPPARAEKVVGLDLGLKELVVTSDGERIDPPKCYRCQERKLARAQRAFARKKRGSQNRTKARLRVARIHQKIKNQRQDFLHKLTTRLVRKHEGLCIEDFCLKGLARTKRAKSVLDASWGELRRMLAYKCLWSYKHLVVIDRWFPSSKTCTHCGSVNQYLTLADRTWVCVCGEAVDRDLNAAQNIRLQGLLMMDAVGHTESQKRLRRSRKTCCSGGLAPLNQESHGFIRGSVKDGTLPIAERVWVFIYTWCDPCSFAATRSGSTNGR
jgi:putative transposase